MSREPYDPTEHSAASLERIADALERIATALEAAKGAEVRRGQKDPWFEQICEFLAKNLTGPILTRKFLDALKIPKDARTLHHTRRVSTILRELNYTHTRAGWVRP